MIYLYKIISILTFVLPQTPFFLTSKPHQTQSRCFAICIWPIASSRFLVINPDLAQSVHVHWIWTNPQKGRGSRGCWGREPRVSTAKTTLLVLEKTGRRGLMLRSCEHLDDLFEGGGSLVGRFAGVSVRKMTRTKRMEWHKSPGFFFFWKKHTEYF